MKLILASILAALSMAAPIASAQHTQPAHGTIHNHYYNRPPVYRHPPRHVHRHNDWVGPAIITGIGAAIIVDQMHRRNERNEVIVEEVIVPQPVPQPNIIRCNEWREVWTQDGRYFRERICTERP